MSVDKLYFLSILIILSMYSCTNEAGESLFPHQDTRNKRLENSLEKHQYTKEDMQGDWTAYGETVDNYYHGIGEIMETPEMSINEIINWRIRGDSIWSFNCLCELDNVHSFAIRNNLLYLDENKIPAGRIEVDKYSLFITNDNAWMHSDSRTVYTKGFIRDTFNDDVVKQTIQERTNKRCMLGNLTLKTHFEPDDEAPFDLTFPVEMPETISISDTRIAGRLFRDSTLALKIGDLIREFNVDQLNWTYCPKCLDEQDINNKSASLYLSIHPGNWWNGESFSVTYESSEEYELMFSYE